MSRPAKAKRVVGLVLLAMSAVLLASALNAPNAEAKKKKRNVVQCAEVGFECVGTNGKDLLVGTPGAENIFGKGGNDTYQANGGNTFLFDFSAKSSDSYTAVDPGAGRNTVIFDAGGSADFLDMGSFSTEDVTFIRFNNGNNDDDELIIRGPEFRSINVDNHFGKGRIEKIKFSDKTLKGKQIRDLVGESATGVQPIPDERPPEDGDPTQEKE